MPRAFSRNIGGLRRTCKKMTHFCKVSLPEPKVTVQTLFLNSFSKQTDQLYRRDVNIDTTPEYKKREHETNHLFSHSDTHLVIVISHSGSCNLFIVFAVDSIASSSIRSNGMEGTCRKLAITTHDIICFNTFIAVLIYKEVTHISGMWQRKIIMSAPIKKI